MIMQQPSRPDRPTPAEFFPTDASGLPEATRPQLLELGDDDAFDLRVGPVAKPLGEVTVRMLGYNGSIPGPTLKVQQGSEVVVHVTNEGDLETTVHWHGLRLENKYDGVPHETQTPIPVGGDFTYRIRFPDPGLYWYHPHIREDYTQEMGLYGNILVVPPEPGYWPPANRDVLLTLDDLLLEDGKIAPFSPDETTYTAMGRFGNVLLIGGEPDLSLTARAGEVVRLWLTNTANTRVFNVTLPGAQMKLVGGDSGRVEHEEFISEVLLSPSERAVVDVLFDRPGQLELQHRTPGRARRLATITVTPEPASPSLAGQFHLLRHAPELAEERQGLAAWLDAPPDKTLEFAVEAGEPGGPAQRAGDAQAAPHAAGAEDHHGDDHGQGLAGGIEWEDDKPEANRLTTPANLRWKLVDPATGAANAAIDWHFTEGDRVKIRLVNDMDHPMQHPFHLHGAGRFLVLARDGVAEPNLVWKDTVLVCDSETVDILFDITNPGLWMAHCHIAEHMQSGMMFSFTVARAQGAAR
jgi:FtsP/CotA-like multicopper oxidase with cupredoxin domain